jgi:hypothetical protein
VGRNTSVVVEATWRDADNHFYFNVCYRSKGAFLRACRSKKAFLVNAVDVQRNYVIRNENLQKYREMK